MNKFYTMLLICSIVFISNSINIVSLAEQETLEGVKTQLGGDPYKIAQWMGLNIRTTKDSIGYAQLPERMFKWRKGDCEDWAILSRYFIGNKYETHLIVWSATFREDSRYYAKMKGRKIGHCVVAIKIAEGNWGIIDQDRYIPNGNSLSDIIKINCDLRVVIPIRAYIADLKKMRHKIIEEIDLGGINEKDI